MKLLTALIFFLVCDAFAESVWDMPMNQATNATESSAVENAQPATQNPRIPVEDKRGRFIGYVDAETYFAVDSVPIYDDLIERYENKHDKLAGIGNVSLLLGIGMAVGGICLLTSDNSETQTKGVIIGFLSPYPITAGIILKAVGSKQNRHVERFKNSRDNYIAKKHTYLLSLVPTFNLETNAPGAKVAVEF